jgi:hypothetical protein
MGLPQYGIKQDPATRTVQDLIPMEGPGPVFEIPYEELQPGAYIVNETPLQDLCLSLDFGCSHLEEVFASFSEKINGYIEQGELPADTQATMVIEDWQQNLKKVTLRITWVDEQGQNKEYSREAFIHADRGGE